MGKIKVYRFRYYDRNSEQLRDSGDYATASAIGEIGADVLPDTEKEVEDRWVSMAGILMQNPP